MATIIVMGDSWSCTQFNSFQGDWPSEWYPPQLSISNRLRSLGHTVFEMASPGVSMMDQIKELKQIGKYCQQVDWIVCGWTEWSRDTKLRPAVKHPSTGSPFISLGKDYNTVAQQQRKQLTASLNQFTRAYPNLQWLHWGGLADVWAPVPHKHHEILYPSYLGSRLPGNLTNRTNLVTYSPKTSKSKHIHRWISTVFPLTHKGQIRSLTQQLIEWHRFQVSNPDALPDGGHPAFALYDQLTETIHNRVQQHTK